MDLTDFLFDEHGRPKVTAPEAKLKEWMNDYTFELVTTEAELKKVIDACIESGLYALDLEATGLDVRVYDGRTVTQIVGYCISPDGQVGYYIPVRHKEAGKEKNISLSLVEREMRRLVASDAVAIFHNAKYDQELLQFNGGQPIGLWDDYRKYEDTFILAYLRDSRAKRKGLKFLSKQELDMDMIELNELFPQNHKGALDYSLLNPEIEEVLAYAASDAICTYKLYEILHPQVIGKLAKPDQSMIYAVEKSCLAATRWMERCRLPTNKETVKELIRLGQQEMFDSLKEVYDAASAMLERNVAPAWFSLLTEMFDPSPEKPIKSQVEEAKSLSIRRGEYEGTFITKEVPNLIDAKRKEKVEFPEMYDILSAKQLGQMMREMGVQGLRVTAKSKEKYEADKDSKLQIVTTKDEMDRLMEELGTDTYPFMAKIKRFRETQKALSSNLLPMFEDSDETGELKINFRQQGTDTGRFTTPGQKDRGGGLHGGTRFNLHSLPSTYDPSRPECMQRIRECIQAREGYLLAAIDFSGEELRIATNFSGEVKWLEEFFRCSQCSNKFSKKTTPPKYCPKCGSDKIGDLHTLTALSIFGQDAKKDPRWKALRGQGKATNFALAYGGGRGAVQRAVGCSENEGARIKAQFDKTYSGLSGWWQKQKNSARAKGFVLTAFGRKYPVPDAVLPKKGETNGIPNGRLIAKAQRNAINGPIQGTGADILKIAMAKIYHEAKKRDWLDKARILACMHDEILFELDEDIIDEAIKVYTKIMATDTVASRRWRVPLTVDVELGKNWLVPYDLYAMQAGKEEWPNALMPLFGVEVDEAPKEQAPNPSAKKEITQAKAPKRLEKGEVFNFRLKAVALSYGVGERLARCIYKSRNTGTHPLTVTLGEEEIITEGDGILVNPFIFEIRATDEGLL